MKFFFWKLAHVVCIWALALTGALQVPIAHIVNMQAPAPLNKPEGDEQGSLEFEAVRAHSDHLQPGNESIFNDGKGIKVSLCFSVDAT